MTKEIPYDPPQGPTDQMHQGPGLGGTNCGKQGSQGPYSHPAETSGKPGIGGTNHGNSGTQKG